MTFHAPALLAFDIGVIEGRAIEALRYGIADEELLLVSASYAAAINLALGLMASAPVDYPSVAAVRQAIGDALKALEAS